MHTSNDFLSCRAAQFSERRRVGPNRGQLGQVDRRLNRAVRALRELQHDVDNQLADQGRNGVERRGLEVPQLGVPPEPVHPPPVDFAALVNPKAVEPGVGDMEHPALVGF